MLNSDVGPLFAKRYSTLKLRNARYICNKRRAMRTVLRATFSIYHVSQLQNKLPPASLYIQPFLLGLFKPSSNELARHHISFKQIRSPTFSLFLSLIESFTFT